MLPNNIKVVKEYNFLIFNEINNNTNYDYILTDSVITPCGIIKKCNESDDTSNNIIRLNSKDITLPIHVSSKITGDKIEVKNMNGSKKVSSIFIEEKISKTKREVYPIVKDHSGVVLWVPGIKKSKFDIEKNKVYDIILKYEKGENV